MKLKILEIIVKNLNLLKESLVKGKQVFRNRCAESESVTLDDSPDTERFSSNDEDEPTELN